VVEKVRVPFSTFGFIVGNHETFRRSILPRGVKEKLRPLKKNCG
jgi:hypothetical protein